MNGPEVTEAIFISTGMLEFTDVASQETIGTASPEALIDAYFEACDRAGVARPAILDRVFCVPFLALFRGIDRFERRIAIAVNDDQPKVEAPVATPSLSPEKEHAI